MEFQSTPLIRGATERGLRRDAGGRISIHAPHTRGDAARGWLTMTSSISIHAPHTRGDWSRWSASPAPQYFNPRPSYEGRRHHLAHRDCDRRISIHAPHTRGDGAFVAVYCDRLISIHAPHTRGDCARTTPISQHSYFNPRPSYEGRLLARDNTIPTEQFQSTPLIRGATGGRQARRPHERHFNPRPSYEGRLSDVGAYSRLWSFQSTPLIRGATPTRSPPKPARRFQSTPLIRGATYWGAATTLALQFQSTPLIRGATRLMSFASPNTN